MSSITDLTLYWGSGSPVSWRALLALEIKKLPYQSHRLDLGTKEHRSDAFLAISPRGSFPVLVHGEIVVRESLAILSYLEVLVPDPSLFGDSSWELAEAWRHIGEHDSYLGEAVQTLTRAFFRKDGAQKAGPETLAGAVATMAKELVLLEERLGKEDWLVGQRVSAADLVYYPTLHRLLRAASKPLAQEHGLASNPLAPYPGIQAWLARLAELPGIEGTYPPHWR